MKEVDYVPEVCKEEGAEVKGSLRLSLPSAAQRMRYMRECGYSISEDGKVIPASDKLEGMAKLLEIATAHILGVTLQKKDGSHIESVDDLMIDSDCFLLAVEVANKIVGGFQMGKQ